MKKHSRTKDTADAKECGGTDHAVSTKECGGTDYTDDMKELFHEKVSDPGSVEGRADDGVS